jgi:hypothetical protein
MSSRHAVIQNGVVINTIEYASTPNPVPGFPDDVIAVSSDTASVGWLYSSGTFTDPHEPSQAEKTAEAWVILRHFRDSRLNVCDWTQANDTQLSEAEVVAWKTYRQELRDLPATVSDPANPSWPTPPAI